MATFPLKITEELDLPDKRWKLQPTKVQITIDRKEENDIADLVFSAKLPSHILQMLQCGDLDISQPSSIVTSRRITGLTSTRTDKLKPIVSASTLSKLLNDYHKLCNDAFCMQKFQKMEAGEVEEEKFIALRFTSKTESKKSAWQFAEMGEQTSISFQYFIVFRQMTRGLFDDRPLYRWASQEIGYNNEMLLHDRAGSGDWKDQDFARGFTLLEWTPEREAFLNEIKSKFKDLSVKLYDLLQHVDSEKIDGLIEQSRTLQISFTGKDRSK